MKSSSSRPPSPSRCTSSWPLSRFPPPCPRLANNRSKIPIGTGKEALALGGRVTQLHPSHRPAMSMRRHLPRPASPRTASTNPSATAWPRSFLFLAVELRLILALAPSARPALKRTSPADRRDASGRHLDAERMAQGMDHLDTQAILSLDERPSQRPGHGHWRGGPKSTPRSSTAVG